MKDTNEIESLRRQLAEKDAEIERLSDEIGYQSQWKTEFRQQKEYAEKQLAASLAREQQLREWIEANGVHDDICNSLYLDDEGKHGECSCGLIEAIALPKDTTAMSDLISKSGIKYFIAGAEYAYSSISGGDGMTITEKEAEEAIRANMDGMK